MQIQVDKRYLVVFVIILIGALACLKIQAKVVCYFDFEKSRKAVHHVEITMDGDTLISQEIENKFPYSFIFARSGEAMPTYIPYGFHTIELTIDHSKKYSQNHLVLPGVKFIRFKIGNKLNIEGSRRIIKYQ